MAASYEQAPQGRACRSSDRNRRLVKPLPDLVVVDALERKGINDILFTKAEVICDFVGRFAGSPAAFDGPGSDTFHHGRSERDAWVNDDTRCRTRNMPANHDTIPLIVKLGQPTDHLFPGELTRRARSH